MKHATLVTLGLVTGLALLTLLPQRHASLPARAFAIPSASAASQDTDADPEIAAVKATLQQYLSLTPQALRSKYHVLQETNQVPSVLEMDVREDRAGDTVMFRFDKGVLYQVMRRSTNGSAFNVFLNKDGSIGTYEDRNTSGLPFLTFNYYTNGQLREVFHLNSRGMMFGPARFYNDAGNLILSTNYTEPTTPEEPEQLRPQQGSAPKDH